MDQCICHMVSGSKIIFSILYVDNILLKSNDMNFVRGEPISFLTFHMKDISGASYVIGIKISWYFGFVSRNLYNKYLRDSR